MIARRLVVSDGSPGRAVKVVILSALQRPEEAEQADKAQRKSKRHQDNQNFHQTTYHARALSALSITMTDEPDIAAAAIRGVTSPAIAIGTARTL